MFGVHQVQVLSAKEFWCNLQDSLVFCILHHTNDSEAVSKLTCVVFGECESANSSGCESGALSPSDSLLLHIRTSVALPLGASNTSLGGPTAKPRFQDGEPNPQSDEPLES